MGLAGQWQPLSGHRKVPARFSAGQFLCLLVLGSQECQKKHPQSLELAKDLCKYPRVCDLTLLGIEFDRHLDG